MKRTSRSRFAWALAASTLSLMLALGASTPRAWAGSASSPPEQIDGPGNVAKYVACAVGVFRATLVNGVGDMVAALGFCGLLMSEEK